MPDAEKAEAKEAEGEEAEVHGEAPPTRRVPGWVRPVSIGLAVLLSAGAAGFGIGYVTRDRDSGPDLSEAEAFALGREQARKEVGKEMTRDGFEAGKRSGRSHGIIAGGMAAESAVTIVVREQAAATAQSEAASAQSELAGISSGPPPPTP